jgi:two-component system CheB/CheR fusion protein
MRTNHLIVGIGASAGGLAAFQSFFSALPSDSGMAFILVQHLDPNYNSTLAELIGHYTTMPVVKAVDGAIAAPNTVAVIPQNAILKIEDGVLRIAPPETPSARQSSVDTFLVSLAQDQGENAVGIILSGFGSDGTIGVQAIKEGGGLTLSEADFDHHAKLGMPQSASAGGFVDNVLQPQEMPARLLEYRDFRADAAVDGLSEDSSRGRPKYLSTICAVLNSRLGRDFSQYKSSTLMRRVHRRMHVLSVKNPNQYIQLLRNLPDEPELLMQEILIGVTRFFRDPAMFEALAETGLPDLLASGAQDEPLRIWVAACATGEEAYSLAILLREALANAESPRQVTIFATDVNDQAIKFARAGLYGHAIETDITASRLEKYFVKEGQRYRVSKSIRDMCTFSTHDLVKDPPFSKLHLVSCRNVLIYFEPALQQRVLTTFHYGIKLGGLLWLGPSETLAASARLFNTFDKPSRIFKRLDVTSEVPRLPSSIRMTKLPSNKPTPEAEGIDGQAARIMAQYAPAYIVFDDQHEIQRFSGNVAKFIEPASGGASLNLFRMLHAQLRLPVRTLVRRSIEDKLPVQERVTFEAASQPQTINLIVEPLADPVAGRRCLLLAFQEITPNVASDVTQQPDATWPGPDADHGELVAAQEKLRTITEELETANEELQSSNEEFQSVNEELHSTVEELETSKEELQSINEELQTVNAELNTRADSLLRSNSDLANLFDNTSIAALFLDNASCIRRFTPAIKEIFNLRDGDEGRPIGDFASRLAGTALTKDIATVLRDLGSLEREVESEDGATTYLVRVKPYRDLNNVIDGVVITLINITDRKRLEGDRALLAAIVTSSQDAIISHDLDGKITSWNAGAEKIYGYTADEIIGQSMSTLLGDVQVNEWPDNMLRMRRGELISDIDISRVTKDDRVVYVSLTISPMRDTSGTIIGASAVARDIGERKAAEIAVAESEARYRLLAEEAQASTVAKGEFLSNMSHELRTPLTSVLGFAGLLESLPDLPETARSYARRIATSGESLLTVVNDILDFSKLEAGSVVLHPNSFDPAVFLAETIQLVSVQAKQKGLTLTTEIDGPLPAAVLADSARVRQVLLNLLSNAIKFTEAGQVRVTLNYQPEADSALRFAVIDSGIGIPADRFDRLFQRFSQVDGSSTRQYGGTGLGLAICKALTELMGGQIGAESRLGEGSTFWFTFAAPSATLTQPEPVEFDAFSATDRTRLLVVDDLAVNRELVRIMLSPFGYEITESADGAEAVAVAMTERFDLILMDLQMPVMDGLAATRAIRTTCEPNRLTPIIALSANVTPRHISECAEAGMDDHIAKPIVPKELLTKIAQWTGEPRVYPELPPD